MLNLMRNERMKIWGKKSSWVMVILMLVALIGMAAITKWIGSEESTNWQENEKANVEFYQSYLADGALSKKDQKQIEDALAISEYRLANDVAPIETESMQSYMSSTTMFMTLISLFAVVVAGGIVSSEYAKGTIKMLLTRPVSRAKVLLSKLGMTIEFAIILTVLTFIISYVIALIMFGSSDGVNLAVEQNKVVERSIWGEIFISYGLSFVSVIVSIIFAFMLGTIFRSSSLAIGVTIFLSFIAPTIVQFFAKYDFIKYIWFSVQKLENVYYGTTTLDITMTAAVTVIVVYCTIFLVLTFLNFMKTDVKS